MTYDLNPKFGVDQHYSETAREIADLLWEVTNGDPSAFPRSYLENFRHNYEDGKVSMLELIDRVDLGPDATYEDYCEVVDLLMEVDPAEFGNPDSIVEIQPSHLSYELESDFDFSEFSFAEDIVEEEMVAEGPDGMVAEGAIAEAPDPMSDKMELFLKKVISSVYRDGVTAVTDKEGNPPNQANNYLLSPDGSKFEGIFYDSPPNEQAKKFPFVIVDKGGENWAIQY
jgi:hypothetical protein